MYKNIENIITFGTKTTCLKILEKICLYWCDIKEEYAIKPCVFPKYDYKLDHIFELKSEVSGTWTFTSTHKFFCKIVAVNKKQKILYCNNHTYINNKRI